MSQPVLGIEVDTTCRNPECRQPMHTFIQPALMANRPARVMAHCINRTCPRRMITLEIAEHDELTPELLALYAQAEMGAQGRGAGG